MTRILAFESSCDETGVAIVEDGTKIIANHIISQIDIHREYGGVVPEIASRKHTEVISQMTQKVLAEHEGRIDAIAATRGPGLMGSLLVGLSFAKALAYSWNIPFVPVHHLEGHIFSVFLNDSTAEFPALALLVSGGHTSLIGCAAAHDYEILGSTRDDAVGECFDKVARLLKLSYPGGPSIQAAAETGNASAITFPRGLAKSNDLDFSYSGLKTAVLYAIRDDPGLLTNDVAASFQEAAVDVLLLKTKKALAQTRAPRLFVAGGVAANTLLRARLSEEIDVPVHMPALDLCIDNAAMIGAAAHSRFVHGMLGDISCTPEPGMTLA